MTEKKSMLDNYIVPLDNVYTKMIDKKISNRGLITTINEHSKYLDCTRIWNSGIRPMQTPFYPYKLEVSTFIYLIGKLAINEQKEYYYKKLEEIHTKNLKYEEMNPPVLYDKRQTKVVRERKKRPVLSDEEKQRRAEKEKQKQTIREAKAMAKTIKLNLLGLRPRQK